MIEYPNQQYTVYILFFFYYVYPRNIQIFTKIIIQWQFKIFIIDTGFRK